MRDVRHTSDVKTVSDEVLQKMHETGNYPMQLIIEELLRLRNERKTQYESNPLHPT